MFYGMKVSFIVPVYNVEKYLNQCIESLLCQTYSNFEILLVDDGSPDNCPALCDIWSKQDNRIKVVHKQNGGLSDARNVGLDNATGDYVIFVDSDDFWVSKDSLNQLVSIVESNKECDFIGFNCSYYYPKTNSYRKWIEFDSCLSKPIDKNKAMQLLVASGTMPMSACLKVISRKSLSDMKLKFIKGLRSEDIPWFIDLLSGSNKCMFINQYVYAYRQNVSGSITSSFNDRYFNDLLWIIQNELERIYTRDLNENAKNALLSFLAYELCILLAYIKDLPKTVQCEARKKLYEYKWLLNYTINPKVRIVSFVNKFLGIRFTENILRFYLNHH